MIIVISMDTYTTLFELGMITYLIVVEEASQVSAADSGNQNA